MINLMFFFFQAEDGIRACCLSRGLGDVYKRQNYYQRAVSAGVSVPALAGVASAADDAAYKSYVSFKLDPKKVPDLPAPRPMYEIWVYSPRFEGVHLRFGKVARGGLRWSDR